MTEFEWLECCDPAKMLHFLLKNYSKLSQRKLRLFTVACCRSLLYSETEEQVKRAVDTLEWFAERHATDMELFRANREAERVWTMEFGTDYVSATVYEATLQEGDSPFESAIRTAASATEAAALKAGRGTRSAERAAQSTWIRDIFPSPYRPKFVSRGWFTWNGGMIPSLAQVIYNECRFRDLPILADALEEAGCTNADVLSHCRQPCEHVRGCWVVDLLLGKE